MNEYRSMIFFIATEGKALPNGINLSELFRFRGGKALTKARKVRSRARVPSSRSVAILVTPEVVTSAYGVTTVVLSRVRIQRKPGR